MDLKPIENITIKELNELRPVLEMTISEAVPIMRKFRDKHGLSDAETKNVCRIVRDFDW